MLERLALEIGVADLEGVALIQKFEGSLCFDVTARLHGECGPTVQHRALQELHRALVTVTTGMLKQIAEILRQLGPDTVPRHQLDLPELLTGGEFHPIRRESVLHEPGAESFRGGMVFEHCYEYCAHGAIASPASWFSGIADMRSRM